METIIVKMEGDPSSETVETVEQAEVEHIKKLQPVNRTKNEIKEDIVPQEVLESTMQVENGYFERFIVKRKCIKYINTAPVFWALSPDT